VLKLEVLEMFLKSNNEVITFLIGVVSILVSFLSAYYGRKAYRVAKEIFEKGLRIDRKKVLQQISLEFVTGFFIPLANFRRVMKPVLEKSYDKEKVLYIRGLIKDNAFSVRFPYFDVHKGEVWDSLIICEDMDQATAFNSIMDFAEKARNFDRAVTDLSESLNDYLYANGVEENQRRANSCMKDFFDICQSVNRDMFNQGMRMMEELAQYEYKLPKELEISDMKRKLFRN
jgi:tetratricopeptide (TPR) repeat protein